MITKAVLSFVALLIICKAASGKKTSHAKRNSVDRGESPEQKSGNICPACGYEVVKKSDRRYITIDGERAVGHKWCIKELKEIGLCRVSPRELKKR